MKVADDAWNTWLKDDVTRAFIEEIRSRYSADLMAIAGAMTDDASPHVPQVQCGRVQAFQEILSVLQVANPVTLDAEPDDFVDPARMDDPAAAFVNSTINPMGTK